MPFDPYMSNWQTRYVETGRFAVLRKGKLMVVDKKRPFEDFAPEYAAERLIEAKWTRLKEED